MAARLIREDQVSRKDRLKRAGALSIPPANSRSLSDLLIADRWKADEARQTLAQEFTTLGSSVDMELRQRITTIHHNDAALDKQSKALRNRANALTKTTRQYGGIADGARIKMKELGDIQNWAEMVEHDLLLIEETLRIVNGDDDDEH